MKHALSVLELAHTYAQVQLSKTPPDSADNRYKREKLTDNLRELEEAIRIIKCHFQANSIH